MSEPHDNLREAVITILEDHMSASFEGLGRGVVTLSGFEEAADAILALPALSVPEGWVVVPREPTEEMLRAGATDNTPRVATNSLDRMFESVGHIYRAMLSAIPSGSSRGLADQPSASRSLNSSAHAPGEGVAE